jgi:beta-N-acetylhexosaminidase
MFSDDLTMEGAGVITDMAERAHVALAAGCTALLVCNQRPAQLTVVEALKASSLKPASNLQRLKRPFAWPDLDTLRATEKWKSAHQLLKESTV